MTDKKTIESLDPSPEELIAAQLSPQAAQQETPSQATQRRIGNLLVEFQYECAQLVSEMRRQVHLQMGGTKQRVLVKLTTDRDAIQDQIDDIEAHYGDINDD